MEDKYLDKYDKLVSLLTEEVEIDGKKYLLKEEFDKFFVRSNKTAATRIRKIMQMIKKDFDIEEKDNFIYLHPKFEFIQNENI